MSSLPSFIIKSKDESTKLTYSEACEMFGTAQVETLLCEATKRARASGILTSEFDMNIKQALVITFGKML